MSIQVAIVGSGPGGFYAAEALLRADPNLRVDMLERLPTPFGLVRGGVAPDHPKIKEVIRVYDRIARSTRFGFYGNVAVGRDLAADELHAAYHAVVYACGAPEDCTLGIAGEGLPGSHAAGEFVGWYNGHPDFTDRRFDLSHETAVVIGQGNVATDLCRMLLTPPARLEETDIASHALVALRASRVRQVHVIGRRGPAQARFTNTELRELGQIEDCDPVVDPQDLVLDDTSQKEISDPRAEIQAKNLEIFRGFAGRRARASRLCHLRFLQAPVELRGRGRVEQIVLASTRLEGTKFRQVARPTGETRVLQCGLVFRCVSFRGKPIEGVPFDSDRGVIPNHLGRIVSGGAAIPGLYVAGWIKRGPVGIIGTNRADAVETAKAVIEDLPALQSAEKRGGGALRTLLESRASRVVGYEDWLLLDRAEIARGQPLGKVREKFTSVGDMLAALGS